MDLGYGHKNGALGLTTAKAIIQTAKSHEEAIHSEIDRYDAVLNSTDFELELLRERRLAQMKKAQDQYQRWRAMGHGTYLALGQGRQGGDVTKEFFDACKESEMMVVHFHRPSTRICDIFHAHLDKLAVKHLETRFVKIDVDQCTDDRANDSGEAYLVAKLGIVVMPTIVIIKNRTTVHHIRGFDELGGTEMFSVDTLEWLIGSHGGIHQNERKEMPDELLQGYKNVNGVKIRKSYTGGRIGDVRDTDD